MEKNTILDTLCNAISTVYPESLELFGQIDLANITKYHLIDLGLNSIDQVYLTNIAMTKLDCYPDINEFVNTTTLEDIADIFLSQMREGH